MSAHTARQGIFNVLTGRAVCPAPRPDDEAEGLLNADRAEVISELAEKLDSRLRLTRHKTVSKDAIRRFLQLEASAARAATGKKSSRPAADATPDFFQPGHRYALDIWRFHCATVATHPTTGEQQAIGWIQVSDGSWTTYAYSAAEWGASWTDVTEGGADRA